MIFSTTPNFLTLAGAEIHTGNPNLMVITSMGFSPKVSFTALAKMMIDGYSAI
jgi:hypothetical protein